MLKRALENLWLCSLVLSGAVAAAQPAVPIEQEPAHRLVLQNEEVRAFEVRLPPGAISLWHVHRHDGMSVRLADAAIEDEPEDGPAAEFRLRRGAVAYGANTTTMTHRVRNVGDTTFHNLYIELLTDRDAGKDRPAATASDRHADFENERVRALRRILAPGESTAMHTHALNGVAVLVSAGQLEITPAQDAARKIDVKAGATQWIASGTTHALKNVGDAPIEIVDIELK
jgi:quercetin dioxygenase-like cupin family protein